MTRTSNPYRSINLEPYAAYRVKSIEKPDDVYEHITMQELHKKLSMSLSVVQSLVQWGIDTSVDREVASFFKNVHDGVHPETGAALPSQGSVRMNRVGHDYDSNRGRQCPIYPNEMISQGRVSRIIRGELHSLLSSYGERLKTYREIKDSSKKHSRGRERTIDTSPPKAGLVMNLGYADEQYRKLYIDTDNPHIVELRMVAYDEKVSLFFYLPDSYVSPDRKICVPIISQNKDTERITFSFPLQYERLLPEFGDYIVAVDVGDKLPYVATVMRVSDGSVVNTYHPSHRVMSLAAKNRRNLSNVKSINSKVSPARKFEDRYSILSSAGPEKDFSREKHYEALETLWIYDVELSRQRKALSRRKGELATIVGQEIVGISLEWDNAQIIIEDLSFVSNTTNNGRWNYGEVQRWIKHYANLQGVTCFEVNAAYTSKTCSSCNSRDHHFDKRVFRCDSCGLVMDRDENASINIGKRGLSMSSKSRKTRKKRRKDKKLRDGFNSPNGFIVRVPKSRESLKKRCSTGDKGSTERRKGKPKETSSVRLGDIKRQTRHFLDKNSFSKEVNNLSGSYPERGCGVIGDIVKADCDKQPSGAVQLERSIIV